MLQIANILAGSLILAASPPQAEQWYKVTQTGEYIGFADGGSLQVAGDLREFELFVGYIDAQGQMGEIYYAIERLQVDCSTGTATRLSVRTFDIDRRPLTPKTGSAIADPMTQSDFAEEVRAFACGDDQNSFERISDPYKESDEYFGGL